jgi:hypothetical protein
MSETQVVVRGTLKPDGTLELAEAPALPPGPVEVTVRALAVAEPPRENWWEYLQRARAELEAMGHQFSTAEEINAYIEDIRSDDDRIEEAYRQAEAIRANTEQHGC